MKKTILLPLIALSASFLVIQTVGLNNQQSSVVEVNASTITQDSSGNWNWGYSSTFDFTSYYASLDTSSASTARSTLHSIISTGVTKLTYANVWSALQKVDISPNDSSKVLCMYTGKTFSTSATGSSGTTTWNREHTWAKSHGFGSNTTYYPYTDINHLRATECYTNSVRSNLDFGEVTSGGTTDSYGNVHSSSYFEPRDCVKGDIARIMMYMDVRYSGDSSVDSGVSLSLTSGTTSTSTGTGYFGDKATLLKWAAEDPVDDLERRRNDLVYSIQGNRNPFIDYPSLENVIFGTSYTFTDTSSSSGTTTSSSSSSSSSKVSSSSSVVSSSSSKTSSSSSASSSSATTTTGTYTISTFSGTGSYTGSKNGSKDISSLITYDTSLFASATVYYNSSTNFYLKSGDMRLYAKSKSGTSLKITAQSGVKITKCTVTASSGSSYLTTTVASDGSYVTIQNTRNATSGYAKITKIAITYSK